MKSSSKRLCISCASHQPLQQYTVQNLVAASAFATAENVPGGRFGCEQSKLGLYQPGLRTANFKAWVMQVDGPARLPRRSSSSASSTDGFSVQKLASCFLAPPARLPTACILAAAASHRTCRLAKAAATGRIHDLLSAAGRRVPPRGVPSDAQPRLQGVWQRPRLRYRTVADVTFGF